MELSCGTIPGQSEFKNILFKLVKIVVTNLTYSSTNCFFLAIQLVHTYKRLILDKKEGLNKAFLSSKLMHELELQGLLI